MRWLLEKLLGISSNTEWFIAWRSSPPLWLLVLIIIPSVFLFSYIIYRKERTTASSKVKLLLTLLRSAVIFIALIILFQPLSVIEKPITKESTIAVLIDDSLSMNFKDRFSANADVQQLTFLSGIPVQNTGSPAGSLQNSRIDLINAILSNPKIDLINRLKNRGKLKLYTFSSTFRPFEEQGNKIKAEGDGTAIGNAISDLVADLSGQSIGGIILISDGQNNLGKEPLDIIQSLRERGYLFPIYTVVAGNPDKHKDIELSELSAPEVAVLQDTISFNFIIKGSGLSNNDSVRIILSERQAGNSQTLPVSEEIIKWGSSSIYSGTIKYKPQKVGDYIYELKIPVQEDEIIEENNSLEHHLKVVDNVIKVLYVESYPRWEYRRLKNALIRDRTMKTSLFLLSADPDFPQDSSPGITSLVQFPSEPKDLFNYDVIIWGDVNPEYLTTPNISTDKLLNNIKRFVEEMGGGVAFIAGDRFNPNSFRKTILTELLPLVLEDTDYIMSADLKDNITEPFKMKITPEGLSDPIMLLEDDVVTTKNLWEMLPGFFWYYPFKKAKPAARVLALHPILSNKYGLRPIIATQYYGQGRIFLTASDETWRWCVIKGDKYFYTFWSEVVRFLRGGRLLGTRRLQITTDKPKYSLGEKVKITAKLYDQEFKPLKQPSYTAYLLDLQTYPLQTDLSKEQTQTSAKEIVLNYIPDKEGQYEGSITPYKTGYYQLWIESPHRTEKDETKSYTSFYVHYPRCEYEKPLPDSAMLKNIANRTEGAFLKLTEINKLPEIVKPAVDIIYTETKEDDIWDSPMVFLLFLLIISGEWLIRKIVGLI